ncbi:MAG TPA: DUF3305 domain-containing protein [Rhodocyclaceae bacterium]
MNELRAVSVSVALERVALDNRWADHAWRLRGVGPAGSRDAEATFCLDELELRLHPDEAENYLVNLAMPEPRLFVIWRLDDDVPTIIMATASYGEAARMLDAGLSVEGVALPADLRGWIEDFARHYYQPPEKLPRRRRAASADYGARMP